MSSTVYKLKHSWRRAWNGVGAKTDGAEIYLALTASYSERQRKYHTLQHLQECLSLFATVQHQVKCSAEVEVALWFHDAIYDMQRSDNEQRSAEWANSALLNAAVPPEVALRVQNLILATKHSYKPVAWDEQLLVDIDLAILGSTAARFAEYQRQIRAEYGFVPDAVFMSKRQAILQAFLDRDSIYSTEHFRAILEKPARRNLRLAIETLLANSG